MRYCDSFTRFAYIGRLPVGGLNMAIGSSGISHPLGDIIATGGINPEKSYIFTLILKKNQYKQNGTVLGGGG